MIETIGGMLPDEPIRGTGSVVPDPANGQPRAAGPAATGGIRDGLKAHVRAILARLRTR